MSEKVKCPTCMELVDVEFDVCPFCGEDLRGARQQGAAAPQGAVPPVAPAPVAPPPPVMPAAAPPTPPPPYTGRMAEAYEEAIDEEFEKKGFYATFVGREFFGRYADFSGSTARRNYWLTVLSFAVLQFGLYGLLALLVGITPVVGFIVMYAVCSIVGLGILVPSLAIAVRRLRDTGKSPWMILLGLIPLVGPILLLIFFCQKGYSRRSDYSFKVFDGALTAICFILFFTGIYFAFTGVTRSISSFDFERTEKIDIPDIDDFSDDDATFENEEEVAVVEETVAEPAESGTISGHYQLGGTVAGAGIIMELDVSGGSVSGRYRYTKINPPSWLGIEGYFSEGRYFNFIETNDDEMTGEYDCEAVFDNFGNFTGIKGKMTNYKGKTYKVYLTVI